MAKKSEVVVPQALVRALEPLAGGDKIVQTGEEYWQPIEAARFMAAQGWVEIVEVVGGQVDESAGDAAASEEADDA